jgi:hypothetical protein
MPLFPLIIGEDERQTIKALVQAAEQHIIKYDQMRALAAKAERGEAVDGSRNDHLTIKIPMNYLATFTVEEHEQDRAFRHLSLSIINGRRGRGPTPEAMAMVMEEFGFRGSTLDPNSRLLVYPETLVDGTFAVNVLEPLQDN